MRIAFAPGELTSTGMYYGKRPSQLLKAAGWDTFCDLRRAPDLGVVRTRRGYLPRDRRFRDRDIVVLIRPADVRLKRFVEAVAHRSIVVHLVDDWLLGEGHRLDAYGGSEGVRAVVASYRDADAFVVSTERLAHDMSVYRKPTFVQPILLWDDAWKAIGPREPDGTVRIGWTGLGASRAADLAEVGEAVRRVLDAHTHVRFVAAGDEATLGLLGVAGHPRASWVPLVPLDRLPRVIAEFDIGLAPLAPTEVNRAKTDIKVLEYSAAGVVPVCSAFQPEYARFVRDGESGILVADRSGWEDALRSLVEDHTLRARMARAALAAAASRFASCAGDTGVLDTYRAVSSLGVHRIPAAS